MIFPVIKLEKIIQVDDKTRIDVGDSYITPDESAITLIEIEPEAGDGFIDVTSNKRLDWQYLTPGTKTVSVRITTNALPELYTKDILCVTTAEDNLLSDDNDLVDFESDILNWTRAGRDSFLDKHRAARDQVLNELDSAQIWKKDGTRFTASDIIDVQDFKEWSRFLTLKIIMESNSNAIDDIFSQKAARYGSMAVSSKTRASYRLDYDADGTLEPTEMNENLSGFMVRR